MPPPETVAGARASTRARIKFGEAAEASISDGGVDRAALRGRGDRRQPYPASGARSPPKGLENSRTLGTQQSPQVPIPRHRHSPSHAQAASVRGAYWGRRATV